MGVSSWQGIGEGRLEEAYLNTDNPARILEEQIDQETRMRDKKPSTV